MVNSQTPTQLLTSHPPVGCRKKIGKKTWTRELVGWDEDGIFPTNYCFGQNRLDSGKIYCKLVPIKIIWLVRNKTTNIKPPPFLPALFQAQLHSFTPYPLPSKQSRGMGDGDCGWSITAPLCHFFLWLDVSVPRWGHPWPFLSGTTAAGPQHLGTFTWCNAFEVKGQFLCFIELRPRPEVSAGFGLSSHAGWSPRKWMETLGK